MIMMRWIFVSMPKQQKRLSLMGSSTPVPNLPAKCACGRFIQIAKALTDAKAFAPYPSL
jgi:hypothetical protein